MSKKPMSIGDLPEYLKSLKEKGQTGNGMLVDMGQIKPPKKKSYWKHAMAAILFLATIGLGSTIVYYKAPTKTVVKIDEIKPLPKNIPNEEKIIINENEDDIIAVKEEKKPQSFFEWLFGN